MTGARPGIGKPYFGRIVAPRVADDVVEMASLIVMSSAPTIVRFFADSGVLLTNTEFGNPASIPAWFQLIPSRRRSVVPVVPSSGVASRATAPGCIFAMLVVSRLAVTSLELVGPFVGTHGDIDSASYPAV